MSSMNPLGGLVDLVSSITTANVRVSLANCSGILFSLTGASGTTTVTIQEARDAAGTGAQTLSGTFSYFTKTTASPTWTAGAGGVNGTSIAPVTGAGTLLAVYVPQGALTDGYSYLSASHATGTFTYILGALNSGRRVTNLKNPLA